MATILLIEDSAGQRAEVRAALEASGLFDRIVEAGDGIQGLKLLLSEPIDLVLCDLEMPGLDGEKLLSMKGAPGARCGDVPFLVLTATTDPDRRARLLRQGASDAITKPFHTPDLVARLDLHLKLVRAQNELIEKNRELERLSTTDPLTGLRNRRYLDEVLAAELSRSLRYGTPLSIVLADVDDFKQINDQYGHPAGDEVLRRLGRTIGESLRISDCGGRWGGEEFLVILSNNPVDGALVFAERWRCAVEAMRIELSDGQSVGVTISAGVAARKGSVETVEALIAQADAALYAAKSAGRNQVVAAGSHGDR